MAKKRKNAKHSVSDFIEADTLRGVWGVLLVALAIFLTIAAFGVGGVLGSSLFKWLSALLGVGYILLPLSVLLFAIVLFRSMQKKVGVLKIVSSLIFLLSTLGLVNVAFEGRGGIIGAAISKPLIIGIDTIATVLFLGAFTIISLLIAFDVHPGLLFASIRDYFRRENEEDYEEYSDEEDYEDESGEYEDEDEEYEEEEEEEIKKGGFWSMDKKDEDDIHIISAFSGDYMPPPISLLGKNKGKPSSGDIKANMNIIKRTLQNFGIEVEMDEVSVGPTVTRYAMKPAEGVRLARIVALHSNLELALAASPIRIEAPIPGKSLLGIEVPNTSRTTLGLAPLLSSEEFAQSDKSLLVTLGTSITGVPHYGNLARMPHILIAGTTGSGKSATIHNLIVSLLYRRGPNQLRFVMVDPKRVELTMYNSIPHLLTPVITDAKKAILALKWLAKEMDRRYDILEAESARDISSYHENVLAPAMEKSSIEDPNDLPEPMPYIVLVIDELADIMSTYPRELEAGIVRLAQMSRAVGIHIVLSTQRPSVKIITGLIKANIPARIALQVSSQIDSRTILDMGGAEKLLGSGDMLFLSGEMSKPKRMQAPFVPEAEIKAVVKHISKNYEEVLPDEIDFTDTSGTDSVFSSTIGDEDDDDLYEEAKQTVIEAEKASTSYLQRKLRVGYARAARLIDMLEERGVIGPADGSKPREILSDNINDYDVNDREEDHYGEEDYGEEKEEENDKL
jgi:DNA segregation ATPase FtsK/SpoIIIE, S-DNA-T family